MEILNSRPIGNSFKKENIYLGTVTVNPNTLFEELKKQIGDVSEEILKDLIDNGIITKCEYDIFYKDENGYTFFTEDGPETIKGDNSDSKGYIKNVVSVWDYYKEDELFEGVINNHTIIIATEREPLNRYNEDYNVDETNKRKK